MPHFDSQSPRAKRRKIDSEPLPDRSVAISSHTQLRALLVFQQNAAETKQGKKSSFLVPKDALERLPYGIQV